MYLFKRVADYMNGLPISKKVARMLQQLTPMIALITVSWMLKAMYVTLFPYLELKAHFTITISM